MSEQNSTGTIKFAFLLIAELLSMISLGGNFGLGAQSEPKVDQWAEWRGDGRKGEWNESGVVTEFNTATLNRLWEQPILSGYSGPTVSDGLCFVMDRRAAGSEQFERVLCFDAHTGEPKWQHEYEAVYAGVGYVAGPRASVTIADGQAYSIGTMGHARCLDARSGQLVWARDLDRTYEISASKRMPIWGIAASPLVYRDRIIYHIGGAEGACLVALRATTGEEVWRALNDRAQYSSPILVRQAGQDVIVCWTGDSVAAVDPHDGTVHWRHEFTPRNMPIGIATPLVHDNHVFLTSFYDGSLMLKMDPHQPSVTEVWKMVGENERSTQALHSIISTPVWIDDHIYGVDSYGELRCLKASDGTRVWEDTLAVPRSRWSTIHFIHSGKRTWMFNERGELLLAELTPAGFREVSRAQLIEPTTDQLRERGGVCWSHPAFANRRIYLRNDKELICVNLAAEQ